MAGGTNGPLLGEQGISQKDLGINAGETKKQPPSALDNQPKQPELPAKPPLERADNPSPDEAREIVSLREQLSQASTETPNTARRNTPIIGNNPYPHIPPLRAEARDTTPIVEGQDFQPAEFSWRDYFLGRGLGSNYGLIKEGYRAYDNNRFWNPIIRAIRKRIQPTNNARVLDVGCATGYLVKRLKEAGFGKAIGLDISPTALEEAAKIAPEARFEEFNLNTDQFDEALHGTFDAVTALDVLEHTAHRIEPDGREVSGVEHVIPKLVPLLKEGGIFVMTAPVRDRNPVSWLFNLFDSDKSHVSKLPTKKYLEILEANGLEVLKKHHSFLLPWIRIPFLPTAIEVVARKAAKAV